MFSCCHCRTAVCVRWFAMTYAGVVRLLPSPRVRGLSEACQRPVRGLPVRGRLETSCNRTRVCYARKKARCNRTYLLVAIKEE